MAARYFINGLVNSNWSSITNWSLTDGGTGGQTVPSASDDVHFTANSPACTVDASSRVALTLDFTGYTNTITMSQQITVSGSVTLVSAMTISGTGALIVNAAATITANTKTWPGALSLTPGNATITLADNWAVSGLLTMGSGTGASTVNGFQITASAGLTHGGSTSTVSGTTLIILNGTGTVTGPSGAGLFKPPITINTAGTITFASAVTWTQNAGTLTYTAGTVVTTGSTLACGASAAVTLATSGIIWAAVSFIGASTVTLSSDLTLTGLLTLGSTSNTTTLTGQTINAGGGMRIGVTTGVVSGTTVVKLTGTGTVDAPSVTSGRMLSATTIDAGAGTVTFTTPVYFDVGVLKYVSGTVITNATWVKSGGVLVSSGMRGGFD